MEKNLATQLIQQLEKIPEIPWINADFFGKILFSTIILDSSKFYEESPEEKQLFEEKGASRYYYFSLRRILRNKNIKAMLLL
mgnify:FL=1